MSDRGGIRRLIRERQAAVSEAERAGKSACIVESVLALPEYAAARRVMCYCGKGSEVNTEALLREILRSGRELYLPVVTSDTDMRAVRLTEMEALRAGAFGIMEPVGDEQAAPETLDLILTPGVAFDRRGGRMGHGKGYYDRFLSGRRAPVVALAYELQLVDEVPMEAHDVYVDRLVTERTVYDCARERAAGR